MAEELWAELNNPTSPRLRGAREMCCLQKWPKYDEKLIEEEKILLIVQINGKVRDKIEVKFGLEQKEAEKLALKSEKIKALLGETEVKKIIFIPNKLINIVI